MYVYIVNYRATIGLFNIVKLNHGKTSCINMAETLLCTLMHIHTCVTVLIIKLLEFIFFPFCMVIFLTLNLLPFKLLFPILDDFTIFQTTSHVYIHLPDYQSCVHTPSRLPVMCTYIFQTTSHVYIQISLKFVYIIVSQNVFAFLSNLKAYFADWSFSLSVRLLTMLFFLIVLGGNVHKNPGPLSFCHRNLGRLPTDNFLKKILLQAFLCVNDFDIVILRETHLCSKINENELNI